MLSAQSIRPCGAGHEGALVREQASHRPPPGGRLAPRASGPAAARLRKGADVGPTSTAIPGWGRPRCANPARRLRPRAAWEGGAEAHEGSRLEAEPLAPQTSEPDGAGSPTTNDTDHDPRATSARVFYPPPYVPPSRVIRTPHSGYHYDAAVAPPGQRFFEGWYFKLSFPADTLEAARSAGAGPALDALGLEGDSIAWMYAIEDPDVVPATGGADARALLQGGQSFPGVAAQVMGPGNTLLLRKSTDTQRFWGSTHHLSLGCAFRMKKEPSPFPLGLVAPQEFDERVTEGFQVSPCLHQGHLTLKDLPGMSQLGDLPDISWCYTTQALFGWGGAEPASLTPSSALDPSHFNRTRVAAQQRATAGWLAALPVFEPHWQVCMGGGVSTGWVRLGEHTIHFENAPSYSEKNWGASFPLKWFWVQCNAFEDFGGSLAVTAGGGRRKIPWASGTEDVAMIGVHWEGYFWEFVPWKGCVEWQVDVWGSWRMRGTSKDGLFEAVLEAKTSGPGVVLHAPSAEGGFQPMCRDAFDGQVRLTIYRLGGDARDSRSAKEVVLDAFSSLGAVEVGGGPWWAPWEGSCQMGNTAAAIIGAPLDVENVVPWPLQPPGL